MSLKLASFYQLYLQFYYQNLLNIPPNWVHVTVSYYWEKAYTCATYDFSRRYNVVKNDDHREPEMEPSAILNFQNLHFVMWSPLPCYSASSCKISVKSDNQLLGYGKKNDFQYGGRPLSWICCDVIVRQWIWPSQSPGEASSGKLSGKLIHFHGFNIVLYFLLDWFCSFWDTRNIR